MTVRTPSGRSTFGGLAAALAYLLTFAVGGVVPAAAAAPTPASAGSVFAAETAGELPVLSLGRAQLEAKFKHAADFGVTESRGAAGFDAYGKAVDSFLGESSTVRVAGTYRGNAAILNDIPASRLVVVQSPEGAFVSGWQMSEAQLQSVITRGSLGGG